MGLTFKKVSLNSSLFFSTVMFTCSVCLSCRIIQIQQMDIETDQKYLKPDMKTDSSVSIVVVRL